MFDAMRLACWDERGKIVKAEIERFGAILHEMDVYFVNAGRDRCRACCNGGDGRITADTTYEKQDGMVIGGCRMGRKLGTGIGGARKPPTEIKKVGGGGR